MLGRTRSWTRTSVAAAALAALALSGCAMLRPQKQVALQPMELNPGAAGTVAISTDRNGNTVARVKVEHLPFPSALSRDLSTYVVWARPQGQDDFTNKGQLRLGENREGSASMLVSSPSFEVMVTAEQGGGVEAPSEYRILEGAVGGAVGPKQRPEAPQRPPERSAPEPSTVDEPGRLPPSERSEPPGS